MEARIKHIKKKDLKSPPSPVEANIANQRDSSKVVKSWVKEFREDRRDGIQPLGTFDGLFTDSEP